MSVPVGTVLYTIWAMDKPEELGGVETHIADLVLTSELTTTNWGDKHMFFRHQDMAEDVEMFPEWEEYLEKFGIPGDSGCPVARMMRYKGFSKMFGRKILILLRKITIYFRCL